MTKKFVLLPTVINCPFLLKFHQWKWLVLIYYDHICIFYHNKLKNNRNSFNRDYLAGLNTVIFDLSCRQRSSQSAHWLWWRHHQTQVNIDANIDQTQVNIDAERLFFPEYSVWHFDMTVHQMISASFIKLVCIESFDLRLDKTL